MKFMKRKSVLIFAAVVVVLAVTGLWLSNGGWLAMPRFFDLPAFLGGSGQTEGVPGFGSGEHAGQFEGGRGEGRGAGRAESRGEGGGHGENSGFSWDALPGVLANLWIIAFIIAVLVYVTKGVQALVRQFPLRRAPTPA